MERPRCSPACQLARVWLRCPQPWSAQTPRAVSLSEEWPAAGNRPRLHRRHCPFRQRMRASRGRLPRHHPGRKRLPNRRRRYALSEGRRRQRPAGHRHRGPVAMTGGVAAAGVVTTGAGGTGPALACRLEAPIARGAGCEQAAWTPLPEKPPAPTDCGDARSPAPSTLPKLPPRAPGPVSAARSFS